MDLDSLVQVASNAAEVQKLEQRATDSLDSWLKQPDALPDGLKAEDVQSSFKRWALVFKNAHLGYPYFETTLALHRFGIEIGTYRLITRLNGEAEDDYLEWSSTLG